MADSLPRSLVLGNYVLLRPFPRFYYFEYVVEKGQFHARLRMRSPMAVSEKHFTKLEVVRAQASGARDLVHIRSSYNNKYLVLESESERSQYLIVGADEPEEDRTKWTCTLFRPTVAANGNLSLLLVAGGAQHSVQTYNTVFLHIVRNSTAQYWYEVTNLDTLAILPKYVAFKGNNNLYLSSRYIRTRNRLQFRSNDLLDPSVHHEAITLNDGNVRLRSNHFERFWRKSNPEWIWCDNNDTIAGNLETVFRPLRLSSQGNTIALLNMANNKYCMRWVRGGQPRLIDTLTASANSVEPLAVLEVEEAVREREIYNIRYNLDDARIYNVAPWTDGNVVRVTYNHTQQTAIKRVGFTYTRVTQETFTSSHSWKIAYRSRIRVTVIPKFVRGDVQLDASYAGSVEWSEMNEESVTQSTYYDIEVPPMTRSEVTLVLQRGSIDVPYSYTQRDILPNGRHVTSNFDDGLFTGLNTEVITHIIKEESLANLSPSELEEAIRASEAEDAAAVLPSKL